MVIFAAIAMIALVIAGAYLLAVTGGGTDNDASDPQFYTFLAIFGMGTPVAWTALNLALLVTRSQTGGQYVAGLRLAREAAPASRRDAVLWWFCFNPLLFSWPTALVSGLPLAAVISIALDRAIIVVFGVFVIVCIAAPVIALLSAILDSQNRALHDRIVDVVVVPVD